MGCTPTRNLQDIASVFNERHTHMNIMYVNFVKAREPIEGKNVMLVVPDTVNAFKLFQESNDKLKVEFDKLNQMIGDYPFMKAYVSRTPKVCNIIDLMRKSGQTITEGLQKILQLKESLSIPQKVEVKNEPGLNPPAQIDLVNPLSMLNNPEGKTPEQINNEEKEAKDRHDKNEALKKAAEEVFDKLLQYLDIVKRKFPNAVEKAELLSDRTKTVHEKDQFGTLMDGIENMHSCLNEMASKLSELQIN